MKLIRIDRNNQVNGEGLRCVVWCSGCIHHCPQCHNPETWDENIGHHMDGDDFDILDEQLQRDEISGITLTGGDPFHPANRNGMVDLVKYVKRFYPSKTVWCYTGYLYEDIKDLPLMQYIDVLIDGPYIAAQNPGVGKVLWRGSTNQRIINVPESLIKGEIVQYTNPLL